MITINKIDPKNFDKINITRKSSRYIGSVEDVISDYNGSYKEYSDIFGVYLIDKLIGLVILSKIPFKNGYCFTDLIIDDYYQNKGYGFETVKEIINYYSKCSKSNYISIEVHESNEYAIKCYLKCGFVIDSKANWDSKFMIMKYRIR